MTAISATEDFFRRVDRATVGLNSAGFDEWGLDPQAIKRVLPVCKWLYRNYFRVETVGIDHVPEGRVLLIGNHSGQLPLDGLFIMASFLLDAAKPRVVRGMVERWFPSVPFVGKMLSRCGQIVGDERNCRRLLERNQTVMVFPEGIRGSGKTYFHRYQLQRFGTGFLRLALETRTPIVPVAVIGCEETYPSLSKLMPLARLIGAPYVPLLPFGPLPLPSKVTIRYGKPLGFDGDPDAPDTEVEQWVEQVKSAIREELEIGLTTRKREARPA